MTIVAYCVTSHALPDQVLRLVRTLREGSPQAPVLLHHDSSRTRIDDAQLRRLGALRVPDAPVEWGRGSQLDMFVRCIRHAAERAEFDWLVLLSGQDYPSRPLEASERDLARSDWDGYVSGDPVAPPPLDRSPADEFARRYFYSWRRVPSPGPLGARAVGALRPVLALREVPAGTLLGRRCLRTPFGPGLPCRRGSDWLTLNRRCVEILAEATRSRPRLLAHYRRTVLPTESFPHTVLHATPGLRLSGDTRRYTRWRPGSPHPDTLRSNDLDEILASPTDFARKFDIATDARVLDELDRALHR